MTSYAERYAASLMNTFGPPKLILVRGEGAHVWDADGRGTSTCSAGSPSTRSGHGHPALVDAVTDAAADPRPRLQLLRHRAAGRPGRAAAGAARRGPRPKVFLTNSGAEANEAALKLTRRTGRTHLVAAEGGFHGRTMGALALTSKAAYREPFEPLPGDVTFVPYGDAAALAAAVTDDTAAVVLEPIQGEAGVVVPPPRLPRSSPADHRRARRPALARRGADRDGSHRPVVRPPRRRRDGPTS